MLAKLYHSPAVPDHGKGDPVGTSCVGSSEAIMLGGEAHRTGRGPACQGKPRLPAFLADLYGCHLRIAIAYRNCSRMPRPAPATPRAQRWR